MWFRSLLDSLKPRSAQAIARHRRREATRRRQPIARPRLELLEDRTLLSGNPLLREVTVMSRNLYHGLDLDPVAAAVATGNPAVFIPVISQAWANVRATDFPQRAEALADEVLQMRPALIALQEAALWRTGPALDAAPATHVEYDFLQTLLTELAERGLYYAVATTNINWEAELPAATHRGILEDLRLTDRDAILVRTDLPASEFEVSNAQTGDFVHNLVLPLPTGPLALQRGWTVVDATLRGKTFRFVNTHLEPESTNPLVNAIQAAQASELLAGPGNTALPTIFAGDFNSRADGTGTVTYSVLTGAGFTDAWTVTHPGEAGNTSGHAADLRNGTVELTQRIDLVLMRGDLSALRMDVVGEEPADRTPSGLWPSDHAGVVASLRIHVPPIVQSVVINDGSAQRSMVNRLTIAFSEAVTLNPGAAEVLRQGGGSFTTHVDTQLVGGKTVAVLTFSGADVIAGSLVDGKYRLVLHANRIRDGHGNALDGDADGNAGGNRAHAFHRLFGDSDGDGDVDLLDRDLFRSSFKTSADEAGYLWYFDFDGDGDVDGRDNGQFNRRRCQH